MGPEASNSFISSRYHTRKSVFYFILYWLLLRTSVKHLVWILQATTWCSSYWTSSRSPVSSSPSDRFLFEAARSTETWMKHTHGNRYPIQGQWNINFLPAWPREVPSLYDLGKNTSVWYTARPCCCKFCNFCFFFSASQHAVAVYDGRTFCYWACCSVFTRVSNVEIVMVGISIYCH